MRDHTRIYGSYVIVVYRRIPSTRMYIYSSNDNSFLFVCIVVEKSDVITGLFRDLNASKNTAFIIVGYIPAT